MDSSTEARFTYVDLNDDSGQPRDPDLVCPICKEPFVKPKRTNPCNHQFCEYWINTWIKTSKSCPMDRRKLISPPLLKPDNKTLRKLQSLEIVCKCGYRGRRGAHVDIEGLPKCLIVCKTCEEVMSKFEYSVNHLRACRLSKDIQKYFPTIIFGMSTSQVYEKILEAKPDRDIYMTTPFNQLNEYNYNDYKYRHFR
ncbi:hypothetical protein HDU76_011573, partial [Blyttiomyces sp. JEL0837]